MFRDKFWLSLALTVPVVFWSEHIEMLLGLPGAGVSRIAWIPPVLGTVIFFYGGWSSCRERGGAERAASGDDDADLAGDHRRVRLLLGRAAGLIEARPLWWELATLVTIMLLGHWIEMRSISQAQGALQELAKLLPDTATRVTERARRGPRQRAPGATSCWCAPARAFPRTGGAQGESDSTSR
jgi:P-type Cu2+ transporter